jgi:ketosteroid isomerase-like protein
MGCFDTTIISGAARDRGTIMRPADFMDISNLVAHYAEAVADCDPDRVAELFRYGEVSAQGSPVVFRGSDEVRRAYQAVVATGADQGSSLHNITTNLIIDIDDVAGTATCSSMFTLFQTIPGAGLAPVMAGRYCDRFVRLDSQWHFTHRHILIDHSSDFGEALRDTARPEPGDSSRVSE